MGRPRRVKGGCVYVLIDLTGEHLYKGSTKNLSRRLSQHNTLTTKFKYTNLHQPWSVLAYFSGFCETSARMFESITKRRKNWRHGPIPTLNKMAELASDFASSPDPLVTSRGKKVKRPHRITLVCRVKIPEHIRRLPGIHVVMTG